MCESPFLRSFEYSYLCMCVVWNIWNVVWNDWLNISAGWSEGQQVSWSISQLADHTGFWLIQCCWLHNNNRCVYIVWVQIKYNIIIHIDFSVCFSTFGLQDRRFSAYLSIWEAACFVALFLMGSDRTSWRFGHKPDERVGGDDEGSGLDALKAHPNARGYTELEVTVVWVSPEVIQFPSSLSISRLC